MSAKARTGEMYSIGDAAEECGVAPDTIRIWERRYGRPVPVRLPSGHRRYTAADVRWLRRISEALSRGLRPSKVVHLTDGELLALLEQSASPDSDPAWLVTFLEQVRGYERDALRSSLAASMEQLGPRRFLLERVDPLVTRVGRAWADGALEVRHEHFLTVLLEDFLRGVRQSYEADGRAVVLLATLSGESHGIGLQMAALETALAGATPRILGTDTPNAEIAAAARECGARVVAISVSLASGGVGTDRVLADLRRVLPEDVRLVVGGRGARRGRRGPRGIDYVDGLREYSEKLADWI